MTVAVRPLDAGDAGWAARTLERTWGAVQVARMGELIDASTLPGVLATLDGEPAGLATFAVRGPDCELVTLDALVEGRGVGSALLAAVTDAARAAGCRRLWLVTTNDNVRAIGFYQRRGLDLAALHRDAVADARRLKPSIPELGHGGVPIRHELEFELLL